MKVDLISNMYTFQTKINHGITGTIKSIAIDDRNTSQWAITTNTALYKATFVGSTFVATQIATGAYGFVAFFGDELAATIGAAVERWVGVFASVTTKEIDTVHTSPIIRMVKGNRRMVTMSAEKVMSWFQGSIKLAPSVAIGLAVRLTDITAIALSKDDKLLVVGDKSGNVQTYGTLDGYTYTMTEYFAGDSSPVVDIRTSGSNIIVSASAGRLTLRKTNSNR